MKGYGKELIMDLHNCNPETYKNREELEELILQLCDKIKVERGDLHFWDYAGFPLEYEKAPPHLRGTSVVQFIKTSTIVIHTLDDLKTAYVNVFSCDDFDEEDVKELVANYLEGDIVQSKVMDRL